MGTSFGFRLRFVGTKLLQNRPVFNARSNNFKRLGAKALSAEFKKRRHTNINFMLAIISNTRYMCKHVSSVHKAKKQGRLHRRVLPVGPQRASCPDTKTRCQNYPQFRQGRSARPPGAGTPMPFHRPGLRTDRYRPI